jgi:hypothetical protein
MKKTLLLEIIKAFSSDQLKVWAAYCQASYPITNPRLHELARLLYTFQSDWDNEGLKKEQLWSQLYPQQRYRASSMNNHVSDLLQATYGFLATERLRRSEEFYVLQIQELLDLGLIQPAQRVLKKWKKSWDDQPEQGAAALKARYQIVQFEDTLDLLASRRQHTAALQRKSRLLDQYYALEQLTNYCGMLSRQKIVQGQYQLPYLEEIFRRAASGESGLDEQSAVAIYLALARLLSEAEDSPDHFAQLELVLNNHPDALPPSEKRTVYNFVLNYCVQRINLGETHYYQKVLTIYRNLLDENLLLQDQRLSQWTYTNIVTSGSRLKAWEWTEQFLEDYRTYLPPQDQYNAYHYNRTALRYEQGKYDDALQGLHQVEFTDAFYHLAAKTIQLKIYYQREATESFHALLFATRQFVNRNRQLSSLKKKAYLNFLKLARQLFDLAYQRPYWTHAKWQQRYEKLQDRLASNTYTANNKDWVREEMKWFRSDISSLPSNYTLPSRDL